MVHVLLGRVWAVRPLKTLASGDVQWAVGYLGPELPGPGLGLMTPFVGRNGITVVHVLPSVMRSREC